MVSKIFLFNISLNYYQYHNIVGVPLSLTTQKRSILLFQYLSSYFEYTRGSQHEAIRQMFFWCSCLDIHRNISWTTVRHNLKWNLTMLKNLKSDSNSILLVPQQLCNLRSFNAQLFMILFVFHKNTFMDFIIHRWKKKFFKVERNWFLCCEWSKGGFNWKMGND